MRIQPNLRGEKTKPIQSQFGYFIAEKAEVNLDTIVKNKANLRREVIVWNKANFAEAQIALTSFATTAYMNT